MLAPPRYSGSLRAQARHASERLRDKVAHALRTTGHADLQDLKISESRGSVRLNGTVGSFFAKQTAQIAAASIPGVRQLENELAVS